MSKTFVPVFLVLLASCATTTAKPVKYSDTTTEGFRFYDPQPLLVVTCQQVQIAEVPDFERGYAVQYRAYLAKNESSMKTASGLLSESSAKLDDTALLSLLQAWGEKALGAVESLAGLGAATVSGTIPGMLGVYRLTFDSATGQLTGVERLSKDIDPNGRCPNQDGFAPDPPSNAGKAKK